MMQKNELLILNDDLEKTIDLNSFEWNEIRDVKDEIY